MTDILLQIGATKLAVSIVLAAMVWLVQQRVARPAIVHTLWLLVLGTLLVPAVVPLRVLPEQAEVEVVAVLGGGPQTVANNGISDPAVGPDQRLKEIGRRLLALAWVLGAAGFFGWTLIRTIRFQRTLTRAARPVPEMQQHAAEINETLGLARVPRFYTTSAHMRPMVWWTGGRVRVVIPSVFLAELDEKELRAVMAHELAHVRRHDHLVRVLEWLVCSAYWWNPVVWWVRRALRSAEESCCDIVAVSAAKSTRGRYARSLLRAVEVMSSAPIRRTPALASAADIGRDSRLVEKRLRTVLATPPPSPAPRWRRAAGRASLACGLSLGLVYCDAAERLAVPETEQVPTPAESQLVGGAPTEESGLIVLHSALRRDWFVVWNEEAVVPGPRPHAISVVAPPDCFLDPAEPKDGDLQWASDRVDKHIACMMAWAERMEAQGVGLGPNGGCIGFDVVPERPIWSCTSMTPADTKPLMKVGAVGIVPRKRGPGE